MGTFLRANGGERERFCCNKYKAGLTLSNILTDVLVTYAV